MKILLLIAALFPAAVTAHDERVWLYLLFEEAFISNDVAAFSPWLSDAYLLTQTLHVLGSIADSRRFSKEALLSTMRDIGKPSSIKRSSKSTVSIIPAGDSFCAVSRIVATTAAGGKNYEEKEVRKVCFVSVEGLYQATSHTIDVYYRNLAATD